MSEEFSDLEIIDLQSLFSVGRGDKFRKIDSVIFNGMRRGVFLALKVKNKSFSALIKIH